MTKDGAPARRVPFRACVLIMLYSGMADGQLLRATALTG